MSDYADVKAVVPWPDRERLDAQGQRLVGSRCADCGLSAWPAHIVCGRCGNTRLEPLALPTIGQVRTWTRVWVPAPGLEPPYVIAMVALGDVIVPTHVRGAVDGLSAGAPVRVVVDLTASPPFWVEPHDGA